MTILTSEGLLAALSIPFDSPIPPFLHPDIRLPLPPTGIGPSMDAPLAEEPLFWPICTISWILALLIVKWLFRIIHWAIKRGSRVTIRKA